MRWTHKQLFLKLPKSYSFRIFRFEDDDSAKYEVMMGNFCWRLLPHEPLLWVTDHNCQGQTTFNSFLTEYISFDFDQVFAFI